LALSSLFITYSPESNFCNGGMFGECLQFTINCLTNLQYDFGLTGRDSYFLVKT
jgi:hypothetical protein